jgi:hypothetical protein
MSATGVAEPKKASGGAPSAGPHAALPLQKVRAMMKGNERWPPQLSPSCILGCVRGFPAPANTGVPPARDRGGGHVCFDLAGVRAV